MRSLLLLVYANLLMLLCGVVSAQERGIAFSVAWSPDGEKIAVGSSTGIWFFDTSFNDLGYVDLSLADEKWNWPLSVEWNAASDLLAVSYPVLGADGGDIQVIDFNDLRVITRIHTEDWTQWLWSEVSWHASDDIFAAGTWQGKTFVWDALTGKALFEFEESDEQTALPSNSTSTVCWLTQSEIVIVTEREIYVVDTEASVTLKSFDTGLIMPDIGCHAAFRMVRSCGDAIDIASCDWTNGYGEFYVAQREVFRGAPEAWAPLYVAATSYSPDGRTILRTGEGCLLHVIDSDSGQLLADLAGGIMVDQEGHLRTFRDSLAWRPDGSRFAAVGQFGGISIWDAETYELRQRFEGFEVSYEQTTPVYLGKLAGDELSWFNALKSKCLDDLKQGRNKINASELELVNAYKEQAY